MSNVAFDPPLKIEVVLMKRRRCDRRNERRFGWMADGVGMGWWDAPLSDVFLFLFV
jgi:hypothetical protein